MTGLYLILPVAFLIVMLFVFAPKAYSGLSLFQRLIRAMYRLSRWTFAISEGLDQFYIAYRHELATQEIKPKNEKALSDLRKKQAENLFQEAWKSA